MAVTFELCCPPLDDLSIGIDPADGTVCDDVCAIIGPVTITFTDQTDPLVITDLEDTRLTWDDVPDGISFDPETGEVCLDGGELGTYTLGVTYTDGCEATVHGEVAVTFELCIDNSLTITKCAHDDTTTVFDFNIKGPDFPANGEDFTLKGKTKKVYEDLTPGTYIIEETSEPDWDISVSGGNNQNPCTVVLADDDSITIDFTNTYTPPSASLTITKCAHEDTTTIFNFNIKGQDFGSIGENFTLKGGQTKVYSNLTPGTYIIEETSEPDWDISVSGGNNQNPCTVVLADEDDITIDFLNTYTPPVVCKTETAWGGNTAGGGSAWWFYYDASGDAVQTLWAGQTKEAGTVEVIDGMVYITLTGGWELQDVDEPVKIKGYDNIPIERPEAGLFTGEGTYKGEALTVDIGEYAFYAIHLDVKNCQYQ